MSAPAKILVVDDMAQNVKLLADLLWAKGYAPAASPKPEPQHASVTTKQEPSAPAMSKPDQTKGASKSPAAKDGKLTAQHFAIGDKITTKSGKSGLVTHIHEKAGYLFIHNAEAGKTYHVSWASVTKVNGKDAADVLGSGKGDSVILKDFATTMWKKEGPGSRGSTKCVLRQDWQGSVWRPAQGHGGRRGRAPGRLPRGEARGHRQSEPRRRQAERQGGRCSSVRFPSFPAGDFFSPFA